jgi:hypothetical protein
MCDMDEMVEVFRAGDRGLAQQAIDEVLRPAGIPAVVHNRSSSSFPAPASLPGAFFVAVPGEKRQSAIEALREAVDGGVIPPLGTVASAE